MSDIYLNMEIILAMLPCHCYTKQMEKAKMTDRNLHRSIYEH